MKVTCDKCGVTFNKKPSYVREGVGNYCSRSCANRRNDAGVYLSCASCGKPFRLAPSAATKNFRYCSFACSPRFWPEHAVKACKTCGTEFRCVARREVDERIYCSRRCHSLANNAAKKGTTKPERSLYSALDQTGVVYHRQHIIAGKFCVDAFVPGTDIVIQVDGDYWHGNPVRFPEPSAQQRKRRQIDAAQDAYIRACGYTVHRFWESEIDADPAAFDANIAALVR